MTDATDEAVEAAAKAILPLYYDGSPEWAEGYWMQSKDAPHKGDCELAEQKGPVTCDRCVVEDMRKYARAALTAASVHTGERMARAELQRLFAKGCRYCAKGWPISDGDDGVDRGGRYHAQERQYSPGKFGGGFVECEVADERLALAAYRSAPRAEPMAGAVEGWKMVPVEPTIDMAVAGNAMDVKIEEFTNMVLGDLPFGQAQAVYSYRAMLAASPPPPDGWRGIESAPRDGMEVLGSWEKSGVMNVVNFRGSWQTDDGSVSSPTHWRPLPSPPGEELGKG